MSESTASEEITPIRRRGLMLVLSSPSGAGKTTIARALLARDAELQMSVSVTTRPQRQSEAEGYDYFFIDSPAFDRLVAEDRLLEHATVFGNRYGTPREAVETALAAGRDVLFDVDWQGTQQLRRNAASDLVSVFVLPPSLAELERRLRARAQDADEVVRRRMDRATDEMSHWREYDYIVANHTVSNTVAVVAAILAAERVRRDRQTGLADFVSRLAPSRPATERVRD